MRIAVFTDTFYPKVDGIATSILNFSKELIKDKNEIIVFSPRYNPFKELKMNRVSVHRFLSLPLFSYKEVKIVIPNLIRILRLVKRYRPSVIHIHTPGPMGYIGTLCSRIFRIPCAGTYHTLVSEQLMYLSLRKLLKIEKAADKILMFRPIKFFRRRHEYKLPSFKESIKKEKAGKRIIWRLSCKVYNNCDIVIVPSASIKKLLKKKGIKRNIVVISNGINTRLFNPKKRYNKEIKKIVHVGRISFEKNIDRTIRAFSIIAKKHKGIEYHIIGDGPALNSLKRLSGKLRLSNKIKFFGYISYNKLPAYYKKSDFFITASTMETQGLVILEAMASGLPVIGVDAFAIPDIVKNGFNGFVVEPTDIKGMSNYMDILTKNPKLVEILGKNAVISAKLHDIKETSRLLERMYNKLIRDNMLKKL